MMKRTIKAVPIDIESILSTGVNNWYKSFEWPISWKEFVKIEDSVKVILNRQIEKEKDLADIIKINYKIYIEFSNYILALLLKYKIGNNALYYKNNNYYKSVFEEGIPEAFVKFPDVDNRKKTIKNRLRKINLFLEDNNFTIPLFWKYPVYTFNESRSKNTIEFLQKKYKGRIHSISFFDFYKKDEVKPIENKILKKINSTSINISCELCYYIESLGVSLSTVQKDFFSNYMDNLFTRTYEVLQVVKKNIGKKKIKLFMGANTSYYSRIISVAIRSTGGEIHGFRHGEAVNYNYDLVSWLDLSLNDYFYEYTKENAEMLKAIAKVYPPLDNNKCQIRSMENNLYKNIFKNIELKQNDNISTVMLIGNCFRHTSFSSATAIFPTLQLYAELKVIQKLKKLGYKVIYKIHPENLDKRVGFVKDFSIFRELFPDDVEINSDKFETTAQQVDAFVFYYTATSTFLSAFMSNKPIYIYDINLRDYPKAMIDILSKRCNYKLTKLNYI
jgi:hypothetical protein